MKTSITKKAYSRGIGEALQRQGVVQFPTQEFMKQASDQAAGFIQSEPSATSVSDAECLKVAQHLVEINDNLRSRGKTASYPQNISIGSSVNAAIGDMITKVAEDIVSGGDGSDGVTAVGIGDHDNTLQAAAGESDLAAKEIAERPPGYAQVEAGGANIGESSAANIGQEQPMPGAPQTDGTNSVEQASKAASVAATLRKLAEGAGPTAVGIGDHKNTPQNAAGESDLGAKDLVERPEGYAQIAPGGGNIGESPAARVGQEQALPGAPKTEGTNSVEQASAEKVAQARHLGGMSVDSVMADLTRNQ